ncbi:MAG: glycosyltransferase family 2 protein, partial [Ignavibacteriae bacterium]|nr:glycosyltransferase family 2 protein [Ignavibacteriota bacterium]
HPNVGILAFQELRGVFDSPQEALKTASITEETRYCSEFVGCGFAMKSSVYKATRGFPVWVDIYCEEGCVSIEAQALGYQILYVPSILINHRVDKMKRKREGKNYFRFKKQLRNEANYFIVYYPKPFKALLRLFWSNLKNYAVKDFKYFYIYVVTFFKILLELPKTLKYRYPVKMEIIDYKRKL